MDKEKIFVGVVIEHLFNVGYSNVEIKEMLDSAVKEFETECKKDCIKLGEEK